ncbi:unnamed protein product [Caenorhabditis brenneri]
MLHWPDTFQSKTFSDVLNPVTKENLTYEASYSRTVDNIPKFHSSFWRGIDNLRYYNEVLGELTFENQRSVTYPKIIDKVLLIMILIAMLYNSGPQPDMVAYGFLSVLLFLFIIYFLYSEAVQMRKGNRLPLEFKRYYEMLDTFSSMVPSNNDEKLEYHKLKLRMFASLDDWQCTVIIMILLLDIIINSVMIAISIIILGVRADNGYRNCHLDAFLHIISCSFYTGCTLLYFIVCFQNWKWLRKFKSELLIEAF